MNNPQGKWQPTTILSKHFMVDPTVDPTVLFSTAKCPNCDYPDIGPDKNLCSDCIEKLTAIANNTSQIDTKDSFIIKERPAVEIFQHCIPLLTTKSHDYTNVADDADYHSNFKASQFILELFPQPYQSYAALIGTKLARIAVLLNKADVKHESIDDSFVDIINYMALMYERYKEEQVGRTINDKDI